MISSLLKVSMVHMAFVIGGCHQQSFVPFRVQTLDQGIVKQSSVALALMAALNPLAMKDRGPVLNEEGDKGMLGRGVVHVSDDISGVIFQMYPFEKRAQVVRNPGATSLQYLRPGGGHLGHTGTGLFCIP
jgi:hypothetical protein